MGSTRFQKLTNPTERLLVNEVYMNSRELVFRAARFQSPERLPFDLPEPYGKDFYWTGMSPSPDDQILYLSTYPYACLEAK